ncbi:MAG: hypothetical protein WAM82_04500 [Thermoanaerobaculia bacterium]
MAQGLMLQIDDQTERLLRERAKAFWGMVDRIRQKLAGHFFPDSADLIREDRDR